MIKKPLPARRVAFDVLDAVLARKRSLDEAITDHPAFAMLAVRDRAFARNLAATTLRRLGQIDALVDHALERPLRHKAAHVANVLRLGITQILFLGTPPHAAVATAVDLAQTLGHGHLKGLVNAVLRRLVREGRALLMAQDAARLNTPDWLWESWSVAYGEPVCRAIAEAHLAEAPLDITVKDDAQAWAEKLEAKVLPTGSLRRTPGGNVTALPGFAAGVWWVQDAAAALPAGFLGDVAGRRVIDLCAAPGGKTAQLAARGACVTAVDRSPKRLTRLRDNLDRLGLEAELVAADAVDWRPSERADAVLLDAPCSATGTIRRHPDVARLKTPDDVATLSKAQHRLLASALEMVVPGGVVVYGACSLQPVEGPEHIRHLIGGGGPAVPVPIQPAEVGGLGELLTADGALRSLPCHLKDLGGIDGFYAARLRRT